MGFGCREKQVLPYVTKYSFDIKDFDSYDAVYESILSDLGRAEEYLAEDATLVPADRDKTANSFTDARIAHMNLYAVQALIAKVYWSKDDLDNAENMRRRLSPVVNSLSVRPVLLCNLTTGHWIFTRPFSDFMSVTRVQ